VSHFVVVCLLPPGTKESQFDAKIAKLIAPYDENTQVKPRKQPCYCIGRAARIRAREAADAKYGNMDTLRAAFNQGRPERAKKYEEPGRYPGDSASKEEIKLWNKKMSTMEKVEQKAWTKHLGPHMRLEDKTFKAQKDKTKPKPDCEECKGTGKSTTTYNPKSKWDWWVIGGRWPEFFAYDGYDPGKDPDNFETCHLCNGTKVRPMEPAKGDKCNACNGTGRSMKFRLKVYKASAPVSEIILHWKKDPKIPYAMVDPKGRWYEKGQMGWWGMSSNEKKEPDWKKQVKELFEKYPDHVAVAADLHI
jgi:hypothetical protein